MRAYERLLKYVVIHTTSDDSCDKTPSTERQFDLANVLVSEMKNIGITDADVDKNCYVTGHIPAAPGYENVPKIGFIAHNVKDCVLRSDAVMNSIHFQNGSNRDWRSLSR